MNIYKKMSETKHLLEMMRDEMKNDKGQCGSDAIKVAYDFSTMYSKLVLWRENGAKTFRLSKDLIDAFALTDVRLEVTPGDFHYPFDVFLIEGEKPLYKVGAGNGITVDVHALLFINGRVIERAYNSVLVTRDGNTQEKLSWDMSISGISPGRAGYGFDHMWVNMRRDETIIAACNASAQTAKYRDVVTIPEAQRAVNIFFNTIMYINDSTRLPAETESIGAVKLKTGVGKERVRSEYIFLRPPKRYISVHSDKTGRTIDKRWVVRGHWTNQAYGKGHLLRKRIWILPYWKGPELSEIVSKKYKVR